VIVKQVPEWVDGRPAPGLLRDWAALEFLQDRLPEAPVAPRLLAGDLDAALIVMEDLGQGESLVEALLGSDRSKAERQLIEAAQVLARMHGTTFGHHDAYREMRLRFGPEEPSLALMPADWTSRLDQGVRQIGIEPDAETLIAVESILEQVRRPKGFFTLVHGDPCPDNWVVSGDGLRLIDFEFSGFGYDGFALATIDAVYPRMCFPSCWCAGSVPSSTVEAFEQSYREELARYCPDARDDRAFNDAMSLACSAWTVSTLVWHFSKAVSADEDWGIATVRSRILSRLEALLTAFEAYGPVPELARLAEKMLPVIEEAWPASSRLAPFPAFA
jgi:thiamine kinase-like enzyme